jgi:hypothetical protein
VPHALSRTWLDCQARIELHVCPASPIQLRLRDFRATQVGVVQVDAREVSVVEVDAIQFGAIQAAADQFGAGQFGGAKVGAI